MFSLQMAERTAPSGPNSLRVKYMVSPVGISRMVAVTQTFFTGVIFLVVFFELNIIEVMCNSLVNACFSAVCKLSK